MKEKRLHRDAAGHMLLDYQTTKENERNIICDFGSFPANGKHRLKLLDQRSGVFFFSCQSQLANVLGRTVSDFAILCFIQYV